MASHGQWLRFGFFAGMPNNNPQQDRDQDQPPNRRRPRPTIAGGGGGELQSTWQAMERETGWRPEEALLPYAELVRYRHVTHADRREGGVWVDIVGGDGRAVLRNVGLLRYLGGVAFASDDSTWAGIMLQGLRVEGSENDGRVGAIRCVPFPLTCDHRGLIQTAAGLTCPIDTIIIDPPTKSNQTPPPGTSPVPKARASSCPSAGSAAPSSSGPRSRPPHRRPSGPPPPPRSRGPASSPPARAPPRVSNRPRFSRPWRRCCNCR